MQIQTQRWIFKINRVRFDALQCENKYQYACGHLRLEQCSLTIQYGHQQGTGVLKQCMKREKSMVIFFLSNSVIWIPKCMILFLFSFFQVNLVSVGKIVCLFCQSITFFQSIQWKCQSTESWLKWLDFFMWHNLLISRFVVI